MCTESPLLTEENYIKLEPLNLEHILTQGAENKSELSSTITSGELVSENEGLTLPSIFYLKVMSKISLDNFHRK